MVFAGRLRSIIEVHRPPTSLAGGNFPGTRTPQGRECLSVSFDGRHEAAAYARATKRTTLDRTHTDCNCDTASFDGRSGGPPVKAARLWDDSPDDSGYDVEPVYATLK